VDGPLFAALAPAARRILDGVPDLVDRVFPLPGRFRAALPRDVAELSRAFTGGRGGRGASYLGKPAFLSAYLRYFLPWNLYRLCRLLPGLPLPLKAGDTVTDLGAGPLTLPAALWIARPELRTLPLTFRCVDQTGAVLEAGKRFFAALTAAGQGARPAEEKTGREPPDCPWKIQTVRESLPERRPGAAVRSSLRRTDRSGGPAALVTAVNFFNELYWDIPHTSSEALRHFAESGARLLAAASPEGAVLVVEPGVPRAGEFIAALRDFLAALGYGPAAPCPHAGPCPRPGGRAGGVKQRWCHFAFDTAGAPPALLKLSAAAGLPKERAAVSFLLAGAKGLRPFALGSFTAGARNEPDAFRMGAVKLQEAGTAGVRNEPDAFRMDAVKLQDAAGTAGVRNEPGTFRTDAVKLQDAAGTVGVRNEPDAFRTDAVKLREAGTAGGPGLGMPVRILSDPFPLPGGRSGSYGCSERGLALAVSAAGDNAETPRPGALLAATAEAPERRDPKSGALVCTLRSFRGM
jgi:hypothetical protein